MLPSMTVFTQKLADVFCSSHNRVFLARAFWARAEDNLTGDGIIL
jgi:hypothetical protein